MSKFPLLFLLLILSHLLNYVKPFTHAWRWLSISSAHVSSCPSSLSPSGEQEAVENALVESKLLTLGLSWPGFSAGASAVLLALHLANMCWFWSWIPWRPSTPASCLDSLHLIRSGWPSFWTWKNCFNLQFKLPNFSSRLNISPFPEPWFLLHDFLPPSAVAISSQPTAGAVSFPWTSNLFF